jgi:vacuolar-type H+-ATPase subunit D/Vma8
MEKTYTVNVHIGGIVQVKVSALNTNDAEHLALTKASQFIQNKNTSIFNLSAIDAEVIETAISMKEVEKTLQNIKLKIRKNND